MQEGSSAVGGWVRIWGQAHPGPGCLWSHCLCDGRLHSLETSFTNVCVYVNYVINTLTPKNIFYIRDPKMLPNVSVVSSGASILPAGTML